MVLVFDRDSNRPRFNTTQSEMIIVNANLNRIAERRRLNDPNRRPGYESHFHQP